jgi:hypothetical protein
VSAQHCGSTRKCFRHNFRDVACLEEPVLVGVATRMTFQTFNEYNRWNFGWPKTLVTQRQDQSERLLGPFGETADAARIQNQHGLAHLAAPTAPNDLSGDCASAQALPGGGLADLGQ